MNYQTQLKRLLENTKNPASFLSMKLLCLILRKNLQVSMQKKANIFKNKPQKILTVSVKSWSETLTELFNNS